MKRTVIGITAALLMIVGCESTGTGGQSGKPSEQLPSPDCVYEQTGAGEWVGKCSADDQALIDNHEQMVAEGWSIDEGFYIKGF